jgi:hypothetical protein
MLGETLLLGVGLTVIEGLTGVVLGVDETVKLGEGGIQP